MTEERWAAWESLTCEERYVALLQRALTVCTDLDCLEREFLDVPAGDSRLTSAAMRARGLRELIMLWCPAALIVDGVAAARDRVTADDVRGVYNIEGLVHALLRGGCVVEVENVDGYLERTDPRGGGV